MNDEQFLNWIASRFVNIYQESENCDFVVRLRKIGSIIEKLKLDADKSYES